MAIREDPRALKNLVNIWGVKKGTAIYNKQYKGLLEGRWVDASGHGPKKGRGDIERDIALHDEAVFKELKRLKLK